MMPNLAIRYMAIDQLHPDPRNARAHSERQIAKIARSIEQFGFAVPLIVDEQNSVLAGHGRLRAAKKLGLDQVPTVQLEHLSPAQKRAFMLADNRIAEDADWAPDMLASELEQLIALDPDFELTDTGFELAEVDKILSLDEPADAADLPVSGQVEALARAGDLFQVGHHLIFCGDALDSQSYRVLLGAERAAMVFTDPPYARPVDAISNRGRTKHKDFVQGSAEMSRTEFQQFLTTACTRMAEFSADGALAYICMDWRGLRELIPAGDAAFTDLLNIAAWVKAQGGLGSFLRSQHELVAIFKSGKGRHLNNNQMGATGRNRTNVWHYPGNNSFHRGRDAELALHPTVKPIALCADAMLDCTKRGALVLDPFGGSGTTLLAAHRVGRVARLIERDPHYVDVALHRARTILGLGAVNLWTGQQLEPLGPPVRRRPAGSKANAMEASRG